MKTVYYALNNDERHLYQLSISLKALRQFFDGNVEVHLFADTLPSIALPGVRIIQHPSLGSGYVHYTYKWWALAYVEGTDILYLDTDTIIKRDPWLLTQNAVGNFLGRIDFGAKEGKPMQVHYPLLHFLGSMMQSKPTPVLNTGVMYFLRNVHKALETLPDAIFLAIDAFIRNRMPYPCTNVKIVEEVAAALAIGTFADVEFEEIAQEKLPSYFEIIQGLLMGDEAYIIHVWNTLYAQYLQDNGLIDEASHYSSLFGAP